MLRVKNPERSIAFYCDVVRYSVDRQCDELGMVHMLVGTSMIDFLDTNDPVGRKDNSPHAPHNRNVDHFFLRIDPFNEAALLEHLRTAGVRDIEPAQKRYGAEGTGLSIYFHDPDGNQLEVKGSTEPV